MLRPERGEGERPNKRNIRKGSQALLASLIVAVPICMAQQATASSYFFLKPSIDGKQHQVSLGNQTANQVQHLTTGLPNLGGKQSPFRLLTSTDIDTIKSTLSAYKSQLTTLKASKPKDSSPETLAKLDTAIQNVEARISSLEASLNATVTAFNAQLEAEATLKRLLASYALDVLAEEQAKLLSETNATNYLNAQQVTQQVRARLDASLTSLNTALEAKNSAQVAYDLADASLTNQIQVTNDALTDLNVKQGLQSVAEQNLIEAQQEYNSAVSDLTLKSQIKQQALINLNTAQSNYDTLLIPDPTWTAPTYQKENTRLVPYTELQLVRTLVPTTTMIATGGVKAEVFDRRGYNNAPPLPTANEVPIHTTTVSTINFNWGSGNILGSNRSEDVIVRFTANLLVPVDGFYQFYSPADDGTQLNIAGMNVTSDWYDKGGGGTISEPVWIRAGIFYPFTLHYYENGGGAAVGLFTYSPQQGFTVVPSTWMGSSAEQQTTYEEVITYEEVTKYREEIYYTTEPVLTEGTIPVKINEGGEATFTAPAGAVFISSNLRYEAIQRPECGIDINPRLQGNSITLSANNSIWGDPCGGWYKHITGTLTYLGQPTAPLINDPSLLPALQEAQVAYNVASNDYDLALSHRNDKENLFPIFQKSFDLAVSATASAELLHNVALDEKQVRSQAKVDAENNLSTATLEHTSASTTYQATVAELDTASSLEASAKQASDASSVSYLMSQTKSQNSLILKTEAETKLFGSESVTQEAYVTVTEASNLISFSGIQDVLNIEPTPEPEPEQGSAEIPAVIENLMDVDLNAVDPTELTPEQAEQLVEAALVAFETAVEGSPEYEQALDALYLAAEQDDIVLSEELAAIPGLAGAVEVLNFLGNAGADMSPKVREESEKVVVATVVAAGAAIQSAAAAASTASAPSGGSRRVGK
jgi:hypothetical protein